MLIRRADGAEHPGYRWGPFTARIPFVHTRVEWPELLQGIFVAGATGLALVPLLENDFGLSFDAAIACIFIHSVLLSSAPILFGEPFAPGWITPALPLALTFVLDEYDAPVERLHAMTAVSLVFAVLVFGLGITGLGKRFVDWLPPALKGGIIMGAAIAALKRVFLDGVDENRNLLQVQPVCTVLAVGICLILTFSAPIQKYKARYGWLRILAGLGLLPGFLIAAAVGPFVGEIEYEFEAGIRIPPFGELFQNVSPFAIGWPSWAMFLDPGTIALALMGYVILFGDLVTGIEVLRTAVDSRPDEKVSIDVNRSHLSIAIRNALMGIFAPFFPSQGCLWTGVHVIVVQRWKEGRGAVDSLFSGISSYYVFGIPVLYTVTPLVVGLKPLFGIALSLTLVLTGFACSYVAMALPKTPIERGVVLLTGTALAVFPPWVGLTVGIVATLTLVGVGHTPETRCGHAPTPGQSQEKP